MPVIKPNSQAIAPARRTFIEDARRRQIVQAAIEVIAEEGYASASLERIAQRVGISRGLISYHFSGREDLIHAVMATVFTEGAAYMRARVEGAETAAGTLETVLRSNLEFMRDHRAEMIAVTEIASAGGRGELRSAREGIAQGIAALEAILRAGQASGAFRAFDPHVMAVAIRNVIDGVPRRMAVEPDIDIDGTIREIVTLFALATSSDVASMPGGRGKPEPSGAAQQG